jgi:hypothetical protein
VTKPKRVPSAGCDVIIAHLIKTLKYDIEIGKKYQNASDEVDGLIRELPELAPCKAKLVELCKGYRVKANLPI